VSSFKRCRTVELKHGRIPTLATMGYITLEITGKLPGNFSQLVGLKFTDRLGAGCRILPKNGSHGGKQAKRAKRARAGRGWSPTVLVASGSHGRGRAGRRGRSGHSIGVRAGPGQCGSAGHPTGATACRNMHVFKVVAGFYADSPPRAYESELGVQDPVGFWDPLSFTAHGDLLAFKRRRTVELKHGRIPVLATMGYITPKITGKFLGYLSLSIVLKFDDFPGPAT